MRVNSNPVDPLASAVKGYKLNSSVNPISLSWANHLLSPPASGSRSWVGVMGVIKHNLDVIRCADWIIDLGPDGGDKGGEIVVVGTPETVAEHPTSHTGRYLKQVLEQHPPEVLAV